MRWILLLLLMTGCALTKTNPIVVSISPIASRVGLQIIERGGNAMDAAVATAFALAVVDPEAGNIGGGGFMLIVGPEVKPSVIDYRETAPAAVTAKMFATTQPKQALLVGVPGTVRGLAAAHAKYGKLPWKTVVEPAVLLANGGFSIDAHLANGLNKVLREAPENAEFRRVFGKADASAWRPGDRLIEHDLGRTLSRIAESPDSFYTGVTAKLLAEEMRAQGGIVSESDLANYQAVFREPIHGTYRGYDVYAPPPPSSGGIALVEMLNVLENFDLRSYGRWDARTLHLMIETMRRAFCDRACYPGDPAFVPPPPAYLIDKKYAATLASGIDKEHATPSAALAKAHGIDISEPQHTTHFSVIDAHGMAVSNTYTIEELFGSRIVVHGAGFLLNDELADFNPRPGVTTREGMIGSRPNEPKPGKRPLSSMTPTILTRGGKAILITGSPGSRTIINTVLQVVVNVVEFGMSPREAVDAPRIHEQWLPDEVKMEATLMREHPEAIAKLRAMGQQLVEQHDGQGDAHTIWFDEKTNRYVGAADHRKNPDDQAVGE